MSCRTPGLLAGQQERGSAKGCPTHRVLVHQSGQGAALPCEGYTVQAALKQRLSSRKGIAPGAIPFSEPLLLLQ